MDVELRDILAVALLLALSRALKVDWFTSTQARYLVVASLLAPSRALKERVRLCRQRQSGDEAV